ncbi:hypothetical protein GQ602_000039 [Ophiocordyceps camponoti-floridani]|uniref:Uncharacterized protein n=1 Tax=Ophiocordyceps camponoti-floridani TaxID=2030778 RepID=A0A8H4QBD0_9HYPO|nr:hypothetical protein GQ602_000039 [Ophiocordyceps camponoti-floridani]
MLTRGESSVVNLVNGSAAETLPLPVMENSNYQADSDVECHYRDIDTTERDRDGFCSQHRRRLLRHPDDASLPSPSRRPSLPHNCHLSYPTTQRRQPSPDETDSIQPTSRT